jgi:hypothetical protein
MLTQEIIDKFYKDVESLKIKKKGAVITKATGFPKSNVSEYLRKIKAPSENFIIAFYENFGDLLPKSSTEVLNGQKEEVPPISQVNEDPAEYDRMLPLGEFKITVKDYVEDLRMDKKKLQNTIDANLTAMMQILTVLQRHDQAFHETILKSLGRIEGGNIDLILEARKFEAELQIQDSLQGSKAQAGK